MYTFLKYLKENYHSPSGYMGFRDPVTAQTENIIDLHHFIFFFVIVITFLVVWLLLQIIDLYIFSFHYLLLKRYLTKNLNINRFLLQIHNRHNAKARLFKEDKYLEAFWTLLPALVLIAISIPSFFMLYLSEESIETLLTVKAIGYQWYWTYDFTDLFPFWYNLKTSGVDIDDFLIESYMEPTEYLKTDEGQLRLLDTDNILILPTNIHIRLIITSMDTLHSFALPALGIKVDAIPGRLNKVDLFIYRMGVFYGQCSEICGIGHGFMPISLYAISYLNFLLGDL